MSRKRTKGDESNKRRAERERERGEAERREESRVQG